MLPQDENLIAMQFLRRVSFFTVSDECLSNPCLNAVSCQDRVNEYVCNCQSGYVGVNCEEETSKCRPNINEALSKD